MEMYYARYGYYPSIPNNSNLGTISEDEFDDLKISFSSDTDVTVSGSDNSTGAAYNFTLTDAGGNTITVSSSGISEVTMAEE
jgi:hypothetical protein